MTAGRSQCGNWSPDGVRFGPNGVKRHRHCVRARWVAPGPGSRSAAADARSPGTSGRVADAICARRDDGDDDDANLTRSTNSKQQFPAGADAAAAGAGC